MERSTHSLKTIAAWAALLLAAYLVGVAASSTLAAFGVTSFANDRRGEWYLLIAPVTLLVAAVLGALAFRALKRHVALSRMAAVAVIAAVVGFALITWRFANAA